MSDDSAAVVKRTVAKAWALIDSNAFRPAAELVAAELARHPDEPALLKVMARIHLGLEATADAAASALPLALRAAELSPNDSHAWRLVAISYGRMGAYAEARDASLTAITVSPDSILAQTNRVHSDLNGYHVDRGTQQSANEALRLGPESIDAHFAAGRLAHRRWKNRLARTHYAKVLAANPHHVFARYNVANIGLRRFRFGAAAAVYLSILAENRIVDQVWNGLFYTAFSAVRALYVIIGICLVTAAIGMRLIATVPDVHSITVLAAAASVALTASFVAWQARMARPYFRRWIGEFPYKSRYFMAVWTSIPLAALAATIMAVFLPAREAQVTDLVAASAVVSGLGVVQVGRAAKSLRRGHRRRTKRLSNSAS